MPIYVFECVEGHLIESRQPFGVECVECPVCHASARKVFTAEGQSFNGDLPTNACRCATALPRDEKRYDVSLFQEACAERDYAHNKAEESAQRKLPSKNLWGEAKKKANRILAGQEAPVKAQSRLRATRG